MYRSLGLLIVSLLMLTGQIAKAEVTSKAEIDKAIEMTRAVLATDKQAIVAKNMTLSDTESEPFWMLYREYQNEQRTVKDRLVKILTEYASSHENLTDDQAYRMTNEYLKIQQADLDLKTKYDKKFEKVLPRKKVATYFQIENKISAVLNMALANDVPLVK